MASIADSAPTPAQLERLLQQLEQRMPSLKGRARRLEHTALRLAHRLGLSKTQREDLVLAARYQDLGMLSVPMSILARRGSLTQDELAAVRKHTDIGAALIRRTLPRAHAVAEAVLYHHERHDGRGFHGLSGHQIPLLATIVQFADAIEAMANDRPYRPKMSSEQIAQTVREGSGQQFSPVVATAFLQDPAAVLPVARAENSPAEAANLAVVASSRPGGAVALSSVNANPSAAPAAEDPRPTAIAQPLSRDAALHRIKEAIERNAPSPVVPRVLAMAASPSTDVHELASLVATDPVLSSRVLQVANSAAYSARRRLVSTVQDAVRQVGCSTVRNIAVSVGVFDMVAVRNARLNLIQYWQHSMGVARLCERFASLRDPEMGGQAYVIGLCHDLGVMLCRAALAEEYESVIEERQRTRRPVEELERQMLGSPIIELAHRALEMLALPDAVLKPIRAYHSGAFNATNDPMPHILRLADRYAHGLLLALDDQAPLLPSLRTHCKTVLGIESPQTPDPATFHSEVLALTATLARLPEADASVRGRVGKHAGPIWLARHGSYSSLDPIEAALSLLASVETHDRLPGPAELRNHPAMVVLAPKATTPGFTQTEIGAARRLSSGVAVPVMWIAAGAAGDATDGMVTLSSVPALAEMIDFLRGLAAASNTAAA